MEILPDAPLAAFVCAIAGGCWRSRGRGSSRDNASAMSPVFHSKPWAALPIVPCFMLRTEWSEHGTCGPNALESNTLTPPLDKQVWGYRGPS